MPEDASDFEKILQTLANRQVDFIVVGGICAVLNGAPVQTYDLDIVPSREPENLSRLVHALSELDAYYREHPRTKLRPQAPRMTGPGHHLLSTSAGPLDVLGAIANKRDYASLLPHTFEIELSAGVWIRVLDLQTLITTKEETGREKDRLVLPMLRRALEEIERPPT